jgi:hypothetical protein
MKTFKRILGAFMLGLACLFFVLFTGSINAPQKMGGPMNMSASSSEWCLIVLFIDAVLVLIALIGSKMLEVTHRISGGISVVIGVSVLMLAVHNHLNAPPADGINNGLEMPVPSWLNVVVYLVAAFCVMGGLFMIVRAATRGRATARAETDYYLREKSVSRRP